VGNLSVSILRWVAYALLGASVVTLGGAGVMLRRSRSAPYYALRKAAMGRAGRLALGAALGAAIAGATLSVLPFIKVVAPSAQATPTLASTAEMSLVAPRSTATPLASPTRRATATLPAVATPTPPVPLPEIARSPIEGAVLAGEDARIELVALALEKDDSDRPVNPGNEFLPGDHWVYLFFSYSGMNNGVARTFAWYKAGEFYERCSDTSLWEWGSPGRTYYRCRPAGGWEPGEYEIHVFVESRLQGIAQFRIVSEAGEQ
jgi:hypothetical protein